MVHGFNRLFQNFSNKIIVTKLRTANDVVVVAIEKGAFWSSSTTLLTFQSRRKKNIENPFSKCCWQRSRHDHFILYVIVHSSRVAVVLVLLYGCTTWTLTKHIERKAGDNYTRTQWAVLNKSWSQHPTKQQVYRHLPPVSKII